MGYQQISKRLPNVMEGGKAEAQSMSTNPGASRALGFRQRGVKTLGISRPRERVGERQQEEGKGVAAALRCREWWQKEASSRRSTRELALPEKIYKVRRFKRSSNGDEASGPSNVLRHQRLPPPFISNPRSKGASLLPHARQSAHADRNAIWLAPSPLSL